MNKKQLFLMTGVLFAVLLLCFVSCKGDSNGDANTSTGLSFQDAITADVTEDVSEYYIAGTPSAFPDIPYVMKFLYGDKEDIVTYDEYRFYQLYYKSYYDGGDDAYWTSKPEMRARVDIQLKETIMRDHAVFAKAEEYGIALSDTEREELDLENAEFVLSFGGMDAFLEALDANNMTVFYYDYTTELAALYEKLNDYYLSSGDILTEDEDIRALLDTDAYVRCKHILILNDTGDDSEANLALANDILKRAEEGESFDSLMQTYSEDPGLQSEPDGYYFFYEEMDEAFSKASFALKDGEMSGIVESSYGYHIILRCEKEASYLDKNLESIKETYQKLRFYELLDAAFAGWETEYAPLYDTYSDWSYAKSVGNLYTSDKTE